VAGSKYNFEETKVDHVQALQGRLRESDILEIMAATGRNPDIALMESFLQSNLCWTAFRKDKVIAIFGAASVSILSETASPWMIGSKELNGAGIEIVKVSRYYVDQMKDRFSLLVNYIDARQARSVRWLKWLGFIVEAPCAYGVEGLPFHRFWSKNYV